MKVLATKQHIKSKLFSKYPVKEEYFENDIKQECRVDKEEIMSIKQEYLEEEMMNKKENVNSHIEEYFEEDIKEECIVD